MRVHGAVGPHQHHRFSRVVAALLFTCAAVPAHADAASASAATAAGSGQNQQPDDPNREILVIAPLFRDAQPERELDEDAIESYGVSTIDELLGEIQVELGDDADQPLIFVNGERINDLSEIGAFPVEVLRALQIFPRGSAVAVGGRPGQRVVNLSLKREAKNATVTAGHKIATDGDWNADRGEAILTRVHGSTRANITLRARDESSLLESERGILQPEPRYPYSLGGNVISYPSTAGEIDPVLSALAGEIVTVAPLPANANPTLADFAAGANAASVTDLGRYRTLRPSTHNYDLNATYATPLASWLTANATFRLNRNTSQSRRGLPTGLFIVPADNLFSPFSTDVELALYGQQPLLSRSRRQGGAGNLTLNAHLGSWTVNWNSSHERSNSVTKSERQTTSGGIAIGDIDQSVRGRLHQPDPASNRPIFFAVVDDFVADDRQRPPRQPAGGTALCDDRGRTGLEPAAVRKHLWKHRNATQFPPFGTIPARCARYSVGEPRSRFVRPNRRSECQRRICQGALFRRRQRQPLRIRADLAAAAGTAVERLV